MDTGRADFVTELLPDLLRPTDPGFNVFDVMHHGTHEKQLSNVFRWLLNSEATHNLGDLFLRIFVGEVNAGLEEVTAHHGDGPEGLRASRPPLPLTDYVIEQEVNVARGSGTDIADLVLDNQIDAAIVVENYLTSDGHDHEYKNYLTFAKRRPKYAVVLLCRDRDSSLQVAGWQYAAVVTYDRLIDKLWNEIAAPHPYRTQNPECFSFIEQMHRKYVQRRQRVENPQVLDFVVKMCETDQAGRYGKQSQEAEAVRFANDVAEQARERFDESRELLMQVKQRLGHVAYALSGQLNETFGQNFVGKVDRQYSGIYRFTVACVMQDSRIILRFGPSAWYSITQDAEWKDVPTNPDYSHVFIGLNSTLEMHQSEVTLREVLDGLPSTAQKLHDEIVKIVEASQT